MNTTQQDVLTEILQKLDACKQLPNPEPLFCIGKDIIPSCPADKDMRDYINPLIESIILEKGFEYVSGLSGFDELAFVKLNEQQDQKKVLWAAQKISISVTGFAVCEVEADYQKETFLQRDIGRAVKIARTHTAQDC